MRAMHRYDGGRTIPILHGARLTSGQLAALELARRPRTVSSIADELGLSRPATSHIVATLVRARFIRRTEGAHDKRERNVSLTRKGHALLGRVAQARAARFERSFASVPPALAERLATVLRDVITTLDRKGNGL